MPVNPDFEATLSVQSSRKIVDSVVESIGVDPDHFKCVLDMAFEKSYPLNMRSAWAVMHCCARNPFLIDPYINELQEKIVSSNNVGVRRSLLKVYADFVDLNDLEDPGVLINACFEYLESNSEPVGVKVYAMEILCKSCALYSELAPELKSILEYNMDMGTAGFKSRARKIISMLK